MGGGKTGDARVDRNVCRFTLAVDADSNIIIHFFNPFPFLIVVPGIPLTPFTSWKTWRAVNCRGHQNNSHTKSIRPSRSLTDVMLTLFSTIGIRFSEAQLRHPATKTCYSRGQIFLRNKHLVSNQRYPTSIHYRCTSLFAPKCNNIRPESPKPG